MENPPQEEILKSDVAIAKNYLNQEEVSKLDRLVNMFIDFAELWALNRLFNHSRFSKQVPGSQELPGLPASLDGKISCRLGI